jgi:hypothetical protein
MGTAIRRRNDFEDALRDKRFETGCQDVLGDTQAPLELAEASRPGDRVTDDQERSPVADDIESSLHGAEAICHAFPPHVRRLRVDRRETELESQPPGHLQIAWSTSGTRPAPKMKLC